MHGIPIYRQGDAHPQAQACAACEVRSQALFGALDAQGLDRIHVQIATQVLQPDATVYDRGTAGLAVFTIREGVVRMERHSEHGDRRIVRLADQVAAPGQEALPRELMLRWQKALDAAETWVSELSTGSARRRMLHLLRRLADHAGADGRIWLPRREEIGAMLDMTLETASRQISALRREAVLTDVAGRGASVDIEALRRALQAEGAA